MPGRDRQYTITFSIIYRWSKQGECDWSLSYYSTLGFGTTNVSGVYTNNFIRNTPMRFTWNTDAGRTSTINANNNSITDNANNVLSGSGAAAAGILITFYMQLVGNRRRCSDCFKG
jgi:hypothetical protein